MIFVSAQPDELQFAWQTEVQLKNFKELGIDLRKVYVLIGFKEGVYNNYWTRITNKYPEVNIEDYIDTRESKSYAPSIRPYLLSKFFADHEELVDEYMFYYDSDIVLTEIPAFEAMQDNRWHVSPADYISHNYIAEKKSPSLMKDMLNSVGVPESIVEEKGQNVGGVQYFIYGTTSEFWKKVEQDCERMWKTYHSRFNTYRNEYSEATGKEIDTFDFQIWCTDMWCIYWNALLFGTDIYANPELNFIWPKDLYERLEDFKIYHDSGISKADSTKWFFKGDYKTKSPFGENLSHLGFHDHGGKSAQRFYIDLIESVTEQVIQKKEFDESMYPLVSCVMTTYGRFECVERSIALWLLQDYKNKELIIFNTAEIPLELDNNLKDKGIRIINQQYIHGTNNKYTNVGQVRADALQAALGKYYICWDDDDLYLPFHISNGIKYLLSSGKKAYIPMQSYWSPDAGNTFEYARNSMEAACIVDINEIRKYGFADSNGGEHGTWRRKLVDIGELNENNNVFPFESYVYLWGEDIASHKQSGAIEDPNCFEKHKAKSTDFGVRPLNLYSPLRIKLWFEKIVNFASNSDLKEVMQKYLIG